MYKIDIVFNKSNIFDEVSLNSEYIGAKNESDENIYERVSTVSADEDLLNRFLTEMQGVIIEKLREFITDVKYSSQDFSVTMELSGAYDEALTPSVKEDLFAAMSKGVCARWFRFTYPAKSSEWLNQSDALLSRAYAKLCYRKKPQRLSI